MAYQQNVKKGQNKQKKSSSKFSVDMDVKGLIFFFILLGLSFIVVFYLGMIFGKATRDPNAPLPVADTENTLIKKVDTESLETPEDLKVFDIHDKPGSLSSLKKNFKKLTKQTDKMIKEESAAAKEEEQAIAKALKEEKPKEDTLEKKLEVNWPDGSIKKTPSGKLYSIQILATKNRQKAEKIIKQLKQQGFQAYLTEITLENIKIFRVRVGKDSKSNIVSIKKRLSRAVQGLNKMQLVEVR